GSDTKMARSTIFVFNKYSQCGFICTETVDSQHKRHRSSSVLFGYRDDSIRQFDLWCNLMLGSIYRHLTCDTKLLIKNLTRFNPRHVKKNKLLICNKHQIYFYSFFFW